MKMLMSMLEPQGGKVLVGRAIVKILVLDLGHVNTSGKQSVYDDEMLS